MPDRGRQSGASDAPPTGRILVGVSGWRYDSWRGDFYPPGLPRRAELQHLASRLPTVEVNASFYGMLRASWFAARRDETPDGFVFAVKGSRYITHLRRLRGVETALANFFASGPLVLGPKLGPVLWQLPERTPFDAEVLDDFLSRLPRTVPEAQDLAARHDDRVPEPGFEPSDITNEGARALRHAVEARHPSFECAEAAELLSRHDVALVLSDGAGRWPVIERDTADVRYARLHGHTRLYASGYSAGNLDRWAERCRDWAADGRDVYVYFDNDAEGHAPHDALSLIERLHRP